MADTPTSHNFVPQDDYNVRLCGICGYSKSQHTTKPIAESGWSDKPSSIRCFDDWFRREDFGDRDQLERCWANAQNVAARDRKDASPSDFEQLIHLRNAAQDAERFLAWWCESTVPNPPKGVRGAKAALAALREALTPKGEQS